jgi:hypothetical protein
MEWGRRERMDCGEQYSSVGLPVSKGKEVVHLAGMELHNLVVE